MGIFHAYDVRGIYPDELDEKAFYEIGLRMKRFGVGKIAVGRDGRTSSPKLSESLKEGLLDAGVDVIDLDTVTSPLLSYFSAKNSVFGAMITASHNPKEYNGVKFVDERGVQVSYDDGLKRLEALMKKKAAKAKKRGSYVEGTVMQNYSARLKEIFGDRLKRKVRIVLDCSNGVGSLPLPILSSLNVEYMAINDTIDGNFPGHPCDQTKKENLAQLQKAVLENKADLGAMFDGDADRCAFVDEKGDIVRMDTAFLLLSLNELSERKGTVLFDLRFGRAVREEIEKAGGIPKVMRVGNPFYKKALLSGKDAILAGELSGHIMYKEHYGIDDPFFATLKMAEILSKSESHLSEMVKCYERYATSGEISFRVKDDAAKRRILKRVEEEYRKMKKQRIDGISIIAKDWWMNIRASNTEPVLRLIIEGISKEVVESQRKVIELLARSGEK